MTMHVPILVEPIRDALLKPLLDLPLNAPTHYIVDCTLGGGGHTASILEAFDSDNRLKHHKVIAVDRDLAAIESAKTRFADDIKLGRLELLHSSFSKLENELPRFKNILGLVADLGFSSDQIEAPARGLSFQREGPLDMRYDCSQGHTCLEILKTISEAELRNVLKTYGQERFSDRIALRIISNRNQGNIPRTTTELSSMIISALPPAARHGRIHAATRTFQALRILVNNEVEELHCLLKHVILLVRPPGRAAVLSFHSLEDREVKHVFRDKSLFRLLNKKPLTAGTDELRRNPRARSAKLRIAERI
ncbi:MAG: 16S rRNA (cytosine(1402)-N(4))-methyltransferase RsmH [Bdellovibrionota bacterium]